MKYGKYRFSTIFPRTFDYLKNYIPLKHPMYLDKPMPDPNVIIKKAKKNDPAGTGGKNKIIIYAENLLMYTTYFNASNFNFKEESELLKFLKYCDNIAKIQHVLIHEYEHVIQHLNHGYSIFKSKIFPFSERIGLYKYEGIIREFGRFIVPPSGYHTFYIRVPNEVEARLSEWVFLKLKGHSVDAITAMDSVLGVQLKLRSFKEIKNKYETLCLALEEAKLKNDKNHIKLLTREKEIFRLLFKIYSEMNIEAENLVNQLRAKYLATMKYKDSADLIKNI